MPAWRFTGTIIHKIRSAGSGCKVRGGISVPTHTRTQFLASLETKANSTDLRVRCSCVLFLKERLLVYIFVFKWTKKRFSYLESLGHDTLFTRLYNAEFQRNLENHTLRTTEDPASELCAQLWSVQQIPRGFTDFSIILDTDLTRVNQLKNALLFVLKIYKK